MHDRFRLQQQYAKCEDRERAERQRRPVHHHPDQHDRDHDEGALGRDFRARQQQIEGGCDERGRGGPFLDRMAAGDRRDQRQAGANEKEHDARHHRHVIARDRQHMRETRDVHRVVDRRRNRIALAGDQRRGDRTFIAGDDGADALVDRLANAVDESGIVQPNAGADRRRHDLDLAERIAGRADALEKHIAREVVAARPQRCERRR